MDLLNISWSQVADIGFGLFVAGICLKTLLADKDSLLKQRALWKHELTELEKSLQTLIVEAAESSQMFDTRIQRRQKELELLLEKAEKRIATITNTSSNFKMIPEKTSQKREDLWTVNDETSEYTRRDLSQEIEVLDELPQSRKMIERKVADRKLAEKEAKKDQKLQEEKELEEEQEIFRQTSIVDPVVFRIAKRLLLEGKELHVVSRKLELPVSEIRYLDTLLREQAALKAKELPQVLKEKELGTVKSVIRSKTKDSKSNLELELDNIYGGF